MVQLPGPTYFKSKICSDIVFEFKKIYFSSGGNLVFGDFFPERVYDH